MTIPNYDAWRFSRPDDDDTIGTEEGEFCGRCEEPDEDAPRGYRPKPCNGSMVAGPDGEIYCDICGETP